MNFIKNISKTKTMADPEVRIRLTSKNISQWPKFETLLRDNKIKIDKTGRFRYLHGAPVGDLILTKITKNGKPIYKESADEWFDPDSQVAKDFKWTE